MDWVQVVSNLGFPIFAFICCGFALKFVYEHESAKCDKLVDGNLKRLEDLTTAVNKNSETILRLIDKLDVDVEVK